MKFWTVVDSLYFSLSFLLCAFLVGSGMPRRNKFVIRVLLSALVFCGEVVLTRYLLRFLPAGTPEFVGLSRYMLYYISTVLIIWFCYECNLWAALFCATVGYCLEHLAERVYELFHRPLFPRLDDAWKYCIRTAIFVVVVGVIYYFLIRKSKYYKCNIMVDNKLQTVVSVVVVAILVYINTFARNRAFGNIELIIYINIMSVAFSFTGIVLELGLATGKQSEEELLTVKRILHEERVRYQQEKQSTELINIKCHDLRHQIEMHGEQMDATAIASIYETISLFDNNIDTGNEALNVVLRKKSFECMNNDIQMTCFVSGQRLNFIPAHEIYALFGNALDNAIKAVKDLPEEKRIISISDKGHDGFIHICIENYYEGEIQFCQGLPQTRGNRKYHGFGMKSMRYVVEKYGGVLRTFLSGEVFVVEMLFPIM